MLAHPVHSSLFPYSEVEQQIEKWDFVIKVKHGNTLRRLGANVHGKYMDYTMNKLKNKIISLFKFSDDADLILTYTDIDGDIVTLDTDDELRDAVIGQRLNPIRITVQLKSKPDTSSSVESLQSETSSEVPKSNSIFDFQKSNFMDMFNVVDKDLLNSYASEKLNFESDVKKAATCFPPVHKLVGQLSQVRLSKSNQTEPVRESTSTKPSVVPAHPMNRNIAYESKWADFPTNEKVDSVTKQNDSTQTVDVPGSLNPLEKLHASFSAANKAANSAMLFGFPKHIPPVSSNSSYTPGEGGNKSTSNEIRNFPYLPIIHDLCPPQPPYFRRFHLNDLDKPNTIQKDVQCNGCGTHPIVGPKFMSNIKEDHHLCNVCYTQIGNEAEYTEFDCATHRVPRMVQYGYHNQYSSHQFPSLHSRDLVRQQRIKFDSLFIKAMTVLDGTVLPPSTPFTKVWRMRNNGTASWPYGTQLVWVGGDQLGHRSSFVLEFPGNEVPVDKELDVTVDFSTPSRPGRYVSYWRLQSPSLQKFGQRVWVLFEVKDNKHHPNTTATSFLSNFNLNLPPINNTQNASQSTDLNTKSTFGIDINADPFDSTEATESTSVHFVQQPSIASVHFVQQPSFQFVKVPSITSVTNASEAVKDNDEFSWFGKSVDITSTPNEESVKYTSVDPTLVADALANVNDCKNSYDENSVEQTCLNELREMGFKQIELNKEVLRRNKYDLKLTVEDLCGFADWDPLLTELHNMEFYDRELNKKMLVKNGGSIKRTVLDLLVAKKD